MRYLLLPALILASIYPVSYARFNWRKKQYLQSIGVYFMVVAMLLLSVFVNH